ncbi:hypothetical protein [Dokdonia sp. Hel_I_53]|uniref:hypothetical protein n=1 Tax=Dokdonia sp. Hel_I_53 TaxID=1566287 RepID=UPI00119A6D61|nr:hypothetical protein [Dokdonia sp. Hel_I_53]TVZ51898.1 hypothetical protein OD90_1058 [Dokdonia sp. Hel_I_53]
MKKVLFIATLAAIVSSCVSKQSSSNRESSSEPNVIIESQPEPLKEVVSEEKLEPYKKLIFNTKLSVSPSQTHWVLFSNGTFISFPSGTSVKDMEKSALGILQRFNNDKLRVSKSPLVKGWIARTSKGINNFISQKQIGDRIISPTELAVLGNSNINKDKTELLIVHVNNKKR